MTDTVLIAIIAAGGVTLGGLFTLLGTKGKTSADAKTALDTRIDARVKVELERVYKRLDDFEDRDSRRTAAFTRILRAIASQWATPEGPDLDPADIAEIEDTIPPAWIRANPYTPIKEKP